MKRIPVLALFLLALALAALPPAASLYDQIMPKLVEAKRVLKTDPAAALVLVEDAEKAFAAGKDQLPPVIAQGIERALKEARLSVARRSPADLEGRLWLVRGALGKALYDAFFEAVAKKDLDTARELLKRLAEATARGPEFEKRALLLAEKGDIEALRTYLELTYLKAIKKSVELAGDGEDRKHAYALMSKAYGLFLVIQDSPRVLELRPQDFVDALAALAKGDLEAYRKKRAEILKKLDAAIAALKKKAKAPVAAAPASKPPKPPAKPKPKAPPPKPAAKAAQAPPPAVKTAPKPQPAAKAAPPPPPPAKAAPPPPAAPPRPEAEVDTFRPPAWLPKDKQEKVKAVAQGLGYDYLADFLDAVEEVKNDIGAATALLGAARIAEARKRLDRAWWHYTTRVEPVFSVAVGPMAKRVGALLERLRRVPGVRTTDLTTIYSLVDGLKTHFLTGGHDRGTQLWLKLQAFLLGFTGLPRAVFFLLVGALSLFPLYLIRLTFFSGKNIYWRLLGLAFFFLFLPALVEGFTYLAEILAEYGGMPQLAALINLSTLQSLPAQIGWGISVFIVVVLAGWGLRGLAHQFGIISERRRVETKKPEPEPAAERAEIEWDEEF